jgi:hypothetical protein
VKRFEFDKDKAIRQYYHLQSNQTLTDEQINEYLYLEVAGQLEQREEETNSSVVPKSEDNKSDKG